MRRFLPFRFGDKLGDLKANTLALSPSAFEARGPKPLNIICAMDDMHSGESALGAYRFDIPYA